MEVHELMLTDRVIYKDNVCRVISIDFLGGLVGVENEDICELVHIKELSPIQLTPETLELNGIRYQFGSPWWQKAYPFEQPDEYEVHINSATKIIVRYVHELQHALRLCELNGLADNFKIE